MSIDDDIKRMEAYRTLGTKFEWDLFKKRVSKLKVRAGSKTHIIDSRDEWKRKYKELKKELDKFK